MAAKVKMLTLLQEIRAFAQITSRRPVPRSPGLFLAQVGPRGNHATVRRRRLSITIDPHNQPDIPLQVKIHHVKQSPDTAGTAPAP